MTIRDLNRGQRVVTSKRVEDLVEELGLNMSPAARQVVAIALGKFAYELASFLLKFREMRNLMREQRGDLSNAYGHNLVGWALSILSEASDSTRKHLFKTLSELGISINDLDAISRFLDKTEKWKECLAKPFLHSNYKPVTVDLKFLPVYWYPIKESNKGYVSLKTSGFAVAELVRSGKSQSGVGFFSKIGIFSSSRDIFLRSARRRGYFNIKTVRKFDVGKLERLGTKRSSKISLDSSPSQHIIDRLTAVPFASTRTLSLLLSECRSFPVYLPDLVWGPLTVQTRFDSTTFIVSSSHLSVFRHSITNSHAPKEVFDAINEQLYIPLATLVKPRLDLLDYSKETNVSNLFFFDVVRNGEVLLIKPSARSPAWSKNQALALVPFELVGMDRTIWVTFPVASKVESLHGKSAWDILGLTMDFYEDVKRAMESELKYAKEGELVLVWLEPVGRSCDKVDDRECLPRWGVYLSRRPSEFTGAEGIYSKYTASRLDYLKEVGFNCKKDIEYSLLHL